MAADAEPAGGAKGQATPADDVSVRMYKGLLGDCFLLRLSSPGGASHVLIDCGVLQGLSSGEARMKDVAADILRVTGGRLDLLVVTHEHWDHISGFAHAADVFFGEQMTIGALWLGWTENTADPQAAGLRARFEKAKVAVARAAGLAAAMARAGIPGADDVIAGLEDFLGPVGVGPGAAGMTTGRQLIERLKAKAASVSYLEPGQAVTTPGPASLTAHVLGPPRSEVRLFKARPSSGDNKETYLAGDGLALAEHLETGLANRLSAVDASGDTLIPDEETPFPRRYHEHEKTVREAAPDDPRLGYLRRTYVDGDDWRRIDADWLGAAGALALKLDANTNNTSLVLAFETPAKKVLLFAADAQVGNWLSWYDQEYGPEDAKFGADDLLARTVLYKVGHHGSHNATLKDQGLGLMTDPGLVALIPVVEADAKKKRWRMPNSDVWTKLLEATGGRILRGDARPGAGPEGEVVCQDQGFLDRVETPDNDLYVEYRLPPTAVQAL